MMKKIILLSMVINYSIVSGWGNTREYNNAALNSAYQAIQQKVINVSTGEVACKAGTQADVAESFKEEFLSDPDEDAPISEKRRVQRSMALIRAVSKAQAVSGLSLEVSDLHETIALDFHNKEQALEAEKNGLWGSKLGWGACTVVGVCGIVVATQMGGGRNKSAAQLIGGMSVLATTVGGAKFISTIGKEEKLKTHIIQIQVMKNGWENSFKK